MKVKERRQLADLLGLDVNPLMRVFGIEDALLTNGEGKVYGRDREEGYHLSMNDRNAAKLRTLMNQSDHIVAEFHKDDKVSITSRDTPEGDDYTVFAHIC